MFKTNRATDNVFPAWRRISTRMFWMYLRPIEGRMVLYDNFLLHKQPDRYCVDSATDHLKEVVSGVQLSPY